MNQCKTNVTAATAIAVSNKLSFSSDRNVVPASMKAGLLA